VLGVGLREHHKFHVRGIAADAREVLDQIVDLIRRERQSELLVGGNECGTPPVRRSPWKAARAFNAK